MEYKCNFIKRKNKLRAKFNLKSILIKDSEFHLKAQSKWTEQIGLDEMFNSPRNIETSVLYYYSIQLTKETQR